MATYAYPVVGSLPVNEVGTEHALHVLTLIWTEKSETASRVRGRIEADLDAATWIIPAARMKTGQEHRVPLSAPVLALLRKMAAIRHGDHVFPGQRPIRPLSTMAMAMVLRRMALDDITPHGFRSTFRTWAAEQTSTPHPSLRGRPGPYPG